MSKKAKKEERDELSWTPKLWQGKFCSPACGRGCTLAEHNAAFQAGKKLAAECGPSFTVRIWENLGWHYAAISADGRLKVRAPDRDGDTYTVFAGEPDGHISGRFVEHGKTVKEAIEAIAERCRTELVEIVRLLGSCTP